MTTEMPTRHSRSRSGSCLSVELPWSQRAVVGAYWLSPFWERRHSNVLKQTESQGLPWENQLDDCSPVPNPASVANHAALAGICKLKSKKLCTSSPQHPIAAPNRIQPPSHLNP